jgi:iduronate 2-sulfatase
MKLFFLLLGTAAIFSSAAVVASTVQPPTSAPRKPTAPNVLFLMADDFRPEISTYGSPALTPNLARLAKRSLQFERMYAQQAVCNPSRSSLLTGRRPDSLRVWSNSLHFRDLHPDIPTIPLWFKQHGYTSRCVGKIFHNWHTEEKGDPRSWSAPEFLHYANHGDDHPPAGGLPPGTPTPLTPYRYGKGPLCEMLEVPDEAYFDGKVAREATRVLEEIKDRPFFLAVGFWKPHAPFNAPKKYWDLYSRQQFINFNALRPEGAPDIAFHRSTEILKDSTSAPTREQAAEMRHGYFANISFLDAQLGKVLDALESSGVADRTLIVFLADHGYHIGEHTLWGKTSNFEFDAHVPCFLSPPGGLSAPASTRSLSELVDIFPTLALACQLPLPKGLDGKNLLPLLTHPDSILSPAAFTQHPRPAYFDREPAKVPSSMGFSVRTEAVRYTEWRDWKTGKTIAQELYATESDPAETENRILDPKLSGQREKASSLLLKQFPPQSHP